ncbi:precorrin-3B synthase [Rhodoplanes sp. Z2-YC6860]|uniref:precorrin-3B synthase n=1 Tax=Rhodoplanes sp. Z2-YC6860 TaxID=674703 RepID=UPI00078CE23E|nr:precorrin-3B synthase [Rhodoplanes sp. Z2-YC6860]AMN43910.1 precorrin-3B synthase [Rhodoplanes sp. Z2-YC6860]
MNAPMRRGACPGLSAPMATGDGLLARLTPAGSTIPLAAFAGLCAAAQRRGNGVIEITSRGSIQFRGLTQVSAADFAAEVSDLGIPASDGIPVIVDPLSGLDCGNVFDAEPVANELRRALTSAPLTSRLSAKLSVAIDGGGPLHLDELSADIRLRAMQSDGEPDFHVALGGGATSAVPLGVIAAHRAVECAMRLIEVLATLAPQSRMRHAVETVGIDGFKSALDRMMAAAAVPAPRAKADPVGVHALRSGDVAIGIAPSFGHSDAESLHSLVDLAAHVQAAGLRTAPKRALLLVGIPANLAADVVAAAKAMNFIVEASDPRRRVIACAGAPICSAGQIPSRALAPVVADVLNGTEAPGFVHISGCVKGCAYPAAAPMTIVGRNGACEIYRGDDRVGSATVDTLPEQLGRLIRVRS